MILPIIPLIILECYRRQINLSLRGHVIRLATQHWIKFDDGALLLGLPKYLAASDGGDEGKENKRVRGGGVEA